MISIRDIDYDTNEDSEKVFSRLTWAVEKVDGLAGQLITNLTVDTNRTWIGVYDKEKMEFEQLEKDLPLLEEEKKMLNEKLNSTIGHEELMKTTERLGEVMHLIDTKTDRWLELSEYQS